MNSKSELVAASGDAEAEAEEAVMEVEVEARPDKWRGSGEDNAPSSLSWSRPLFWNELGTSARLRAVVG